MRDGNNAKFDQIRYQAEYNKKHYDSIVLNVPKGMRNKIKDYAKLENLSVTKYVIKAIEFYRNNSGGRL